MKSLIFALMVSASFGTGAFAENHSAIESQAWTEFLGWNLTPRAQDPQNPLKQCMQTCVAFSDQPGPQLRQCLADCQALYGHGN
ncbi:MAG: hypothetical protein KDD61_04380 [Bdellovibrionales bacterium]|nr:hypothetical protein [Bdellovibrionales bacterium]